MNNNRKVLKNKTILEADTAWDYTTSPRSGVSFSFRVNDSIAQQILSAAKKHITELRKNDQISLRALKEVCDPAGHFCLDLKREKYFLRISRRKRKNPLLEDKIVKWLSRKGFNVILPIASNINIIWNRHDYLLTIFPFIKVNHFDGSDKDLENVTATLKNLHRILKKSPFSRQIRNATIKTAERLEKTKEKIILALKSSNFSSFYELSNWAQNNRNWLSEAAENFNPYICLMKNAQCIHGEVHTGNVIFSKERRVIFTDFEESIDAWFPPLFDIAYLAHRFCMHDNPSKDLFTRRLQIVKRTYGNNLKGIRNMMHQVCSYIIILIFDRCLRRESIVPDEECDKFLGLDKLTKELISE